MANRKFRSEKVRLIAVKEGVTAIQVENILNRAKAGGVYPADEMLLKTLERALELSIKEPDFKLYSMEPFQRAIDGLKE